RVVEVQRSGCQRLGRQQRRSGCDEKTPAHGMVPHLELFLAVLLEVLLDPSATAGPAGQNTAGGSPKTVWLLAALAGFRPDEGLRAGLTDCTKLKFGYDLRFCSGAGHFCGRHPPVFRAGVRHDPAESDQYSLA